MSAGQRERKEVKVRVKGMGMEDVLGGGVKEGEVTLFSEGL